MSNCQMILLAIAIWDTITPGYYSHMALARAAWLASRKAALEEAKEAVDEIDYLVSDVIVQLMNKEWP